MDNKRLLIGMVKAVNMGCTTCAQPERDLAIEKMKMAWFVDGSENRCAVRFPHVHFGQARHGGTLTLASIPLISFVRDSLQNVSQI